MTSFSDAFKSEIARVARKELKNELLQLRKSVAVQKTDVAALKREVKDLRAQLKARDRVLTQMWPVSDASISPSPAPVKRHTFDAEKLAAHRASLGLTQVQMARLLDASPLSVYKWESGQVQPRAAQLTRIQTVLAMRKRAAAKHLAQL